MELLWFYIALVLAISDIIHTQIVWKLFSNFYILFGGIVYNSVDSNITAWLIHELLEALYKESENKDEVIEYVDLLTDYYAKQRELEILQDKIEQIQIYSKNANDLRSTIKTAFSNTQDTKDIVSELRFNNIQTLAKSNE